MPEHETSPQDSIEVEQKFPLPDREAFLIQLRSSGARHVRREVNEDHYFNHPAKDFGETREALRVRLIDGEASVTYKGPKMPGKIKARRELEWRMGQDDCDGENMRTLLKLLDFRPVAMVRKTRDVFEMTLDDHPMTVVVDQVDGLGDYAEVETICDEVSKVPAARDRIDAIADRLGLNQHESRSYLTMLLEANSDA